MKPKDISKEIAVLQRKILDAKIPVIVLVEGYESSGRGYFINRLIRELDPRTFEVKVFNRPSKEVRRKPFLWTYFKNMPKKGHMGFWDRSYYFPLFRKVGKELSKGKLEDIKNFEKLLQDDGVLLIKYFITVSQEGQRNRIVELSRDEHRSFLVSNYDYYQNLHYEDFTEHFHKIFQETKNDKSPWHFIDGENKEESVINMLLILKNALEERLNKQQKTTVTLPSEKSSVRLKKIEKIPPISTNKYKDELPILQERAGILSYSLYIHKIPSILVFEGWDAAGKGGAIKRLTKLIDPRGYDVSTTAAPTEYENRFHNLWRFNESHPKTGHMQIYDRSWYGRLMVERVEGFATEDEWKRAYQEINDFEAYLHRWGAMILKFFLHISPEEQLKRFEDRQNEPDKNYKITDEDWRNREKWSLYEDAINDMFKYTHTKNAPWHLIDGNQKEAARIEILKRFIESAENALERRK